MVDLKFINMFMLYFFPALILIGVTDTPNHVQPEAALIGEVEDQRVIVTAESETGKETRTGIETENETVKEIERMKETLRFYHQYLKKSLWSRIKVGFVLCFLFH